MSPLIHGDKRLDLTAGKSLFDYADDLNVRVPTSCARSGECHECIVEVRQGKDALSPPTAAESFLRDNYRLACQTKVLDPAATVQFAVLRRQPRILTKGVRREVTVEPLTYHKDGGVWFNPSSSTPAGQMSVTVGRKGEGTHPVSLETGPIAESPGGANPERLDDYTGAIFGIAVDAGTTTVVMNLVNLETGVVAATASFENPQRFGGSDIMRRISYDGGKFHGELQAVMLSSVNFEIGEMCRRLKVRRRQIFEMTVVGNATMRDIFFGLDVQSIGQKPYKSVTEYEFLEGKRSGTAINVKAELLGVRIHPRANVYGGPLIASHVGADTAADIIALGLEDATEPFILVDVGTNTEVVVGTKDRMLAASCPAGPAFEGGEVKYGMPGYDGAIEKIRITDGRVEFETINGKPPQGICGSGLVDLLAELRRNGIMNEVGAFVSPLPPPGSGKVLSQRMDEFAVVPERGITISRRDISALAQAKAANFCGQSILTRKYGLPQDRFAKLYLAGGFANYIDEKNAVDIGFIANVPHDRIVKVGNASLEGATVMLLSGRLRRKIEEFVKTIEHVELETTPDFFDFFVEGCHFKPMVLPEPLPS
ncbi:MAG: DUF4445 domain-containing protein [Dehalococcoidia bacterium]|nr:DUF4445 domain-containing protein [Dehalococcoidia bacterium]MSQ34814.1 DUF4445 domain-containing protein [Dehalococcoidia bacterium]